MTMNFFRAASSIALLTFFSLSAFAQNGALKWEPIQTEAYALLLDYLKLDTTNPPGNEIRAAKFFAAICQREGIEHKVFEPFPGRGTLWARVKGSGSERPIILLNHSDVVPHDKAFWTTEPFTPVEKDGFIYGRGALDMKGLGMAQFVTLLTLHRSKAKRTRDVIFLATADEEAGGLQGAGWFAKNHPELLGKAEFLLNEGGGNFADDTGKVLSIGVGPSEKTPAWLRLTATGAAGHASIPRPDSSVNRLIRALNKLLDYKPPMQLTPAVEQMFKASAPLRSATMRAKFENIRESLKDSDFLKLIESDPMANALLRNTISITMLAGSNKVNIIPPAASADIDTRVVPGEKLDRWIAELKSVINDDKVKIEPILAFDANASPIDTALVKAVATVSKRNYPDAVISYPVQAGFTDCHFFRELGIHSYGFSPFVAAPRQLGGGVHGNDERLGKQAFLDGVKFFYEVIAQLSEK
ncbi:MAG: M20/M25/M40 family metallo-hydrolase [Acidobacteria bacterium]|nr:M20/M25/M40 family metallo-hydrolase [Acidobacteriota bacterium]